MLRLRSLAIATLLSGLAASASGQTSACEDLNQLDGLMPFALTTLNVPGIGLQITKNGLVRYEKAFGSYTVDQVVPIASGSKWLSAACILVLVDQGKLLLDDKVSKYVTSFTGSKANITIRQCLAHTSGLGVDDPSLAATTITLAQCVDYCAQLLLDSTPGSTFNYGEISMQVAGRCAEVATGKSWETIFQQAIAGPLGMTKTDYQGLATTQNPRIGAGARSCLKDYGTFLRMVLNGGMNGASRVLSLASIDELLKDQTNGAILKSQPFPQPRRYGLGCWRDRVGSNTLLAQTSSQGIFGFSPWIDFERRMTGVFLLRDSLVHAYPVVETLQSLVRDVLNPVGVSCIGNSTHICNQPIVHNAFSVPRGGNQDFGLFAFNLPPGTGGVLAFAATPWVVGWNFGGATVYLDTSAAVVSIPVISNAVGETWVPLPVPGLVAGTKFYSQFLFVKPSSCPSGPGPIGASNALSVILQ